MILYWIVSIEPATSSKYLNESSLSLHKVDYGIFCNFFIFTGTQPLGPGAELEVHRKSPTYVRRSISLWKDVRTFICRDVLPPLKCQCGVTKHGHARGRRCEGHFPAASVFPEKKGSLVEPLLRVFRTKMMQSTYGGNYGSDDEDPFAPNPFRSDQQQPRMQQQPMQQHPPMQQQQQ